MNVSVLNTREHLFCMEFCASKAPPLSTFEPPLTVCRLPRRIISNHQRHSRLKDLALCLPRPKNPLLIEIHIQV